MMRRLFTVLAVLAPAGALAFDAVDAIPYPSSGEFPAYPSEGGYPRNLWANVGVMRDDNVLRRPSGGESETISRLGVGARVDQRVYGRQSVRLEARGDLYLFDRFDELNHLAYGLLGEWLWELGNSLSGTLGYARRRFQTDLAERQAPIEDLVTENSFYGSAAYRLTPDWRLRGGFEVLDLDRPESVEAETSSRGLFAGIDYVTPLGNAIGLEVRQAEGDAAVPEDVAGVRLVNNDYDEREIALVAAYNPGVRLRLGARVGRTERTYSELPGRDFDGTTYRFEVSWLPGNKTLLGFEAYKEPRSIIEIAASHVLVEGVSFGPSWAPTAKLVFSARAFREERDYSGDPAAELGVATIREETLRGLRLSAGWELTRRYRLGVAIDNGERSSTVSDREYDYTALMANLRYEF